MACRDERIAACRGLGVEYMVRLYLAAHGYDGLCNPDAGCGCDTRDLMACCEGVHPTRCVAAHKADCARCRRGPNATYDCRFNGLEADYWMFTDGPCPDYIEEES